MSIGENETHISIVRYSNKPTLILLDSFDKDNVQVEIENMAYTGGNTYTGEAINYTLDNVYPKFRINQSAISSIFIILTDGESNDPSVVELMAKQMSNFEISSIVIAIGSGVNANEIMTISNGLIKNIFNVEFNQLEGISSIVEEATCSIPAKVYFNATAEFSLGPNQQTFVKIEQTIEGLTVSVIVKDGDVTAFVSYNDSIPNAASYDEIVIPNRSKFFPTNVPLVTKSLPDLDLNATGFLFIGFSTKRSQRNVFSLNIQRGSTDMPVWDMKLIIGITLANIVLFKS